MTPSRHTLPKRKPNAQQVLFLQRIEMLEELLDGAAHPGFEPIVRGKLLGIIEITKEFSLHNLPGTYDMLVRASFETIQFVKEELSITKEYDNDQG